MLEAYERLILDAMRGDHTLFTTAEGIESLWERSADLLDNPPPAKIYQPGTWGPNAIHQLIAPNAWRLPFERGWREAKQIGRAISSSGHRFVDPVQPPIRLTVTVIGYLELQRRNIGARLVEGRVSLVQRVGEPSTRGWDRQQVLDAVRRRVVEQPTKSGSEGTTNVVGLFDAATTANP